MHKPTRQRIETFIAPIEARSRKATPVPIDVHRYDRENGTIAYQLQQSSGAPKAKTDHDPIGSRVLTDFDDHDNPDAKHDAAFTACAYVDVPIMIDALRDMATRLDEAHQAIRDAVDLLGPEYCDDGKPLNALRRVLEGNGSR